MQKYLSVLLSVLGMACKKLTISRHLETDTNQMIELVQQCQKQPDMAMDKPSTSSQTPPVQPSTSSEMLPVQSLTSSKILTVQPATDEQWMLDKITKEVRKKRRENWNFVEKAPENT